MAAYGLATHHIYEQNRDEFQKYAQKAVQSAYALSRGEILLREALEKLLVDQAADVTEIGRELIKGYPDDPEAYFHLAFFQEIIRDYTGQLETLLKALEVSEDPANIHNSLGYTYLDLGRFEEAAAAFDRYIELRRDEPNPYDSKGDYYMAVEEYDRAYHSYMKAYEMDSSWTGSLRKANRARAMLKTTMKE
jgi:tetratricopeptide (TPR) repeat protein